MPTYLDVDPATLHLPTQRWTGADPIKFTRQFAKRGLSTAGMPPPWVARDGNGRLMLIDGVTRATRVAKFLPGQLIRVQVTEEHSEDDYSPYPTVGDCLP